MASSPPLRLMRQRALGGSLTLPITSGCVAVATCLPLSSSFGRLTVLGRPRNGVSKGTVGEGSGSGVSGIGGLDELEVATGFSSGTILVGSLLLLLAVSGPKVAAGIGTNISGAGLGTAVTAGTFFSISCELPTGSGVFAP